MNSEQLLCTIVSALMKNLGINEFELNQQVLEELKEENLLGVTVAYNVNKNVFVVERYEGKHE